MGFRTDINGLRAVAVIIVVLYHMGVPGFHGGYVGVDVFFVISGYLMTQVVLSKIAKGAFSALDFYAARARRLLPALLALDAVLLVAGFFLLLPQAYQDLCKSIIGSITFTSNIQLWRDAGYFDSPSQTKWLLHTWSLSVEWQFYLLYPVFLRAVAAVRGGRLVRAGLVSLVVLSLAICVVFTRLKPEASFFLLPTRTWELVLGGLLYLWQRDDAKKPRPALTFIGLALIAAATLLYVETLPYPGFYAIVPVAGSALVLAGRFDTAALKNRPAQLVGDVSYSYYLWHWPFIVAARVLEIAFTPLVMTALALGSFAVAVVSHRFVEKPFRDRGAKLAGGPYLVRACAASAAVVVVAVGVYALRGVPARVPALAAENDALSTAFAWNDACGTRSICTVDAGAPPSATRRAVLFWGDSHAAQLYPVVQALAAAGRTRGKAPLFHAFDACPPVRTLASGGDAAGCLAFSEDAFRRAAADDVDAVVIASIWTPYFRKVLYDDATKPTVCHGGDAGASCTPVESIDAGLALAQAQLTNDVSALTRQGKRVFLVLPVPIFDRDVAHELAQRAWRGTSTDMALSLEKHRALVAPMEKVLRDVAAHTGASLIDPAEVLCTQGGSCRFADHAGVSLYKDNNHLTDHGAAMLASALEPAFR